MSMTTDNTCKECGKEKCPKKEHLHGGNGMGLCHGHESEGEKETQLKVCEKGFCCQHKVGHSCCHGSCPPLPPKDGKGEEGWEGSFRKLYRKYHVGYETGYGEHEGKFIDFIRQVAAQAREDDYSKAIEDAKEAVKLYCPKQQNHSAFEKGFDSCKRIVLFVLDKLKKKV